MEGRKSGDKDPGNRCGGGNNVRKRWERVACDEGGVVKGDRGEKEHHPGRRNCTPVQRTV